LPLKVPFVGFMHFSALPSAPLPAAVAPTVAHSAPYEAFEAATGAALATGAAVMDVATKASTAAVIVIFFTICPPWI
jgi:hypothetical protein